MSDIPITLVKTPSVYGLPAAQPTCLEGILYLMYTKQLQIAASDPTPLNFRLVDNKYWINGMDTQHRDNSTTLPILHNENAIVSSHNIIQYLKTHVYDIDAQLSPSEAATIEAFRLLTQKLQIAIQFILIQQNNYPVAQDTFWGVRWFVRTQYEDYVKNQAELHGIYTEEDATLEISSLFASLAARLGDTTYRFGSQSKVTSLDLAVAASVAYCLFSGHKFLHHLTIQYYPTLAKHCHSILSIVLDDQYTLDVDQELISATITKECYTQLVGEIKQESTLTNTPGKKKTKGKKRASVINNEQDDDFNMNVDYDVDDTLLSSSTSTLQSSKTDGGDIIDEQGDGQLLTSLPTNIADFDQIVKADDGIEKEKLLQPDEELPYLTCHRITIQKKLIEDNVSIRIKHYASQSWLATDVWLKSQIEPTSTWAKQFIFFGAIVIGMYFVIVKSKGELEAENERRMNLGDDFDFHRQPTPLINRYKSSIGNNGGNNDENTNVNNHASSTKNEHVE